MKVLKGILVTHTKEEPSDKEVRFYATQEDEVATGDIFSVWAHSKLAYFKVKKVYASYEYIKAENEGIELLDLPQTVGYIDVRGYNIFKAVAAKTKRLTSALHERIDEAKKSKDLTEVITSIRGKKKADITALVDALKTLETDPESALED